MKPFRLFSLAAALLCCLGLTDRMVAEEPVEKPQPVIEAVFVLDTTGSMSGLIQGAKDKIWSIANTLATGTPTPQIRMGLVGYRDRGDAYITKITPLSDDLDAVYGDLMTFQAGGGGDTPESVNQALHEAVTKIAWSAGAHVYKVIFLVGDCPPHMDYQDDVKFPDSCKLAVERGLIINTIQCGTHAETVPIWQQIAKLSEGKYFQVAQSGGAKIITTPYDETLTRLARELDGTRLYYGTEAQQARGMAQAATGGEITEKASVVANASRAKYMSESSGAKVADGHVDSFAKGGSMDLLNDLADKKVALEKLDAKLLPAAMAKMTPEQQKTYVADLQAKRKDILAKITEATKQRDKFLLDEAKKQKETPKDAFDVAIREAMKEQAKAKQITY